MCLVRHYKIFETSVYFFAIHVHSSTALVPAIVLVLLLCFPFSSFSPPCKQRHKLRIGKNLGRVLGRLIFEYVWIEQDPGRYLGRLSIDLGMKKSGKGNGWNG